MVDEDSTSNLVMLIANWSSDLLICTNGEDIISDETKVVFERKDFEYNESVISEMTGTDGELESLIFEDGTIEKLGGMIAKMHWDTQFDFLESLDLKRDANGKLETDMFGETSVPGLFTACETKTNFPDQLINAAADGADVAKVMMMNLIQGDY